MALHREVTDTDKYNLNFAPDNLRETFKFGDWMQDVDGQVFTSKELRIRLQDLREATTYDVGNGAANGGLLASDTSPSIKAINGATDGCQVVQWAAGNNDQVIFQVPLIDAAQAPIMLRLRYASSGTTDAATFNVGAFLDEGNAAASAGGPTPPNQTVTFQNYVVTLDATAMQVEDTTTLTIGLQPPFPHLTDAFLLSSISVIYSANKF